MMPVEQVAGANLTYYLIALDAAGNERAEADGEFISQHVVEQVTRQDNPITDVFLASHGWRGDMPAAREQYTRWISAMSACESDLRRLRAVRDFHPLIVGLHWPSEPWGDESLGNAIAFAADQPNGIEVQLEHFAGVLGDTPPVRSALRVILDSAERDATPAALPTDVAEAYTTLNQESELASAGAAAPPGDDREPFDAESIYQAALSDEDDVSFAGGHPWNLVLEPLRALSFWKMKERARVVGERGGHQLLLRLQQATPADKRVRFHLMGHSFGCIVVSAAVAGPPDGRGLPRSIDSLVLVQGALSLWSFCKRIPRTERSGYFFRIPDARQVAGPIITTRSIHDMAVGRYYPRAASSRERAGFGPGAQDQLSFRPVDEFPMYAALGAFGARGPGVDIVDLDLLATDEPYLFEPQKIYNLECSKVIRTRRGLAGAHSDIAHPEVAHAVFEAAWGSEQRLTFNGLNCSTGAYVEAPQTPAQISALARKHQFDRDHLADLAHRAAESNAHYGVMAGIDRCRLDQAGWGVLFPHDADPAVYDALRVLLNHRQSQAGDRYYEYVGEKGYRPGRSKNRFLIDNGGAPGPVNPAKMPYYILIVGDPESIPYSFQYELDVQFAVGRIHFDRVEDYARYAQSVVSAERTGAALHRRAALFGTQHPADDATSLSAKHLVTPLSATLAERHDWELDVSLREMATKARLGQLLGGTATPAFLFTATHGAAFDKGDPLQLRHQGALLCQEWPGLYASTSRQRVSADDYFSADDVSDGAQLHGIISFHFACYGVGTPHFDDYGHTGGGNSSRTEIAPKAFVASLPKRLLAHPKGGALAVVGHIERAWGCSFTWGGRTREQLATFESALTLLLEGYPVGAALEDFNQRYAELAVGLSTELEDVKFMRVVDDLEVAGLWTAHNDARAYAIIGDPAVKLCVAPAGEPTQEHMTVAPALVMSSARTGEAARAEPTPAVQGATERVQQIVETALTETEAITITTSLDGSIPAARAVTRANLNGSMETSFPPVRSPAEQALITTHLELVQQALTQRLELLKLLRSAEGARLHE